MEPSETPKRPAKRKEKAEAANWSTKTVALESAAHSSMEKAAKKLKMSNAKFASAAINYFTQNGLDPTQDHTSLAALTKQMKDGFALLGVAVTDGVANVRSHNADIGNRLYALTRNFEKTLYAFQHQQQLATYSYMESVESNLLRHLVAMDSDVFQPLFEHLFRTEEEAFITRSLSARIYLKLIDNPTILGEQNAKFTQDREEALVAKLREFLKTHKLATPQPIRKPGATAVPVKPVAPATPAPAVAPKP